MNGVLFSVQTLLTQVSYVLAIKSSSSFADIQVVRRMRFLVLDMAGEFQLRR